MTSVDVRRVKTGTLHREAEYLFHRTSGSIGSLAKLLTLSASDLISNPTHTTEALTVEVMNKIVLDQAAEQNYRSLQTAARKRPNPRLDAVYGAAA